MQLSAKFKFYRKGFFRKIITFPIRFFFWLWLTVPKWRYGIKEIGRENLKVINGRGAVITYTHNMHLDAFFIVRQLHCRSLYMPAQLCSFNKGWVLNKIFLALNVVPIPQSFHLLPKFFNQMNKAVEDGNIVAVAPEGAQEIYRTHLLPFKKGCFKIAEQTRCPILPMAFCFGKRKTYMVWGKPIENNQSLNAEQLTKLTQEKTQELIDDFKGAYGEGFANNIRRRSRA